MNACSACKHGKRKCCRSRPSCALCLRSDKTCVYTEDTVKTHFDVDGGTGQGGNNIWPYRHGNTTELAYWASLSQDGQGSLQVVEVGVTQLHRLAASPNPMTILPNSVDPFFKPLGCLNEQGREAIDYLYRGPFHPLCAMRDCGLVSRVRGTAAFFQLLAFSAWHLAILRNEKQDIHSLQYATRANRELQQQICDPITCTTVESVMAVLVFASSSAQMRDPQTAKIHIDGAQRMLRYRNTLRALESDAWGRAIVFWVETVACSFADLPVHFPAPTEYLAEYKRSNKQVSQWIETNVVDPTISPVFSNPAAVRAINALREVQIIIRSEAYKKDVSKDSLFPSNHMLPIFHDLLAMIDHDRSLLQEGFRLAAMVFIHEIQAMCWGRVPPPLMLDKLYRVLFSSDWNWLSHDPMLFWILAIALTSDMATPHHEAFFTHKFRILIRANRIANFDSIMGRVVQITWDEGVLKEKTSILCRCFEENC